MSSSVGKRRKVALIVGGAHNPCHLGHVRSLVEAVDALTSCGFDVVGAWLAPSTDGYVCGKTQAFAISAKARVAMCDLAMTENGAACLRPCAGTFGSAKAMFGHLRRTKAIGSDVELCVGVGSDRALTKAGQPKWLFKGKADQLHVCVARAGAETRLVLEAMGVNPAAAGAVVQRGNMIFVPAGAHSDVSSTSVRRLLSRTTGDAWDRDALAALVGDAVCRYIETHRGDADFFASLR